jgi:hypothetical protein
MLRYERKQFPKQYRKQALELQRLLVKLFYRFGSIVFKPAVLRLAANYV